MVIFHSYVKLPEGNVDILWIYSGYTLDILWIFLDVVWTHIMAVKCCKGYNTLVQLYI